jgi:hypothetical protein
LGWEKGKEKVEREVVREEKRSLVRVGERRGREEEGEGAGLEAEEFPMHKTSSASRTTRERTPRGPPRAIHAAPGPMR